MKQLFHQVNQKIIPPLKKFVSKKKNQQLLLGLGLLALLLTASAMGFYLTQQSQDIRQQASTSLYPNATDLAAAIAAGDVVNANANGTCPTGYAKNQCGSCLWNSCVTVNKHCDTLIKDICHVDPCYATGTCATGCKNLPGKSYACNGTTKSTCNGTYYVTVETNSSACGGTGKATTATTSENKSLSKETTPVGSCQEVGQECASGGEVADNTACANLKTVQPTVYTGKICQETKNKGVAVQSASCSDATYKPDNCECTKHDQCASKFCKAEYEGSSLIYHCRPAFEKSTSTCDDDANRQDNCLCTDNSQCQSKNCDYGISFKIAKTCQPQEPDAIEYTPINDCQIKGTKCAGGAVPVNDIECSNRVKMSSPSQNIFTGQRCMLSTPAKIDSTKETAETKNTQIIVTIDGVNKTIIDPIKLNENTDVLKQQICEGKNFHLTQCDEKMTPVTQKVSATIDDTFSIQVDCITDCVIKNEPCKNANDKCALGAVTCGATLDNGICRINGEHGICCPKNEAESEKKEEERKWYDWFFDIFR